jgi:predicted DNA-binding transcriptional regulator YafY
MAKADNMLAILWLLISRQRMTATELAEELETSVRTIYRYIDSLCASGVPIIAESGHDGGYRLLKQFVEAPLFFNTDERKALYFASLFAQQAGYPYEGSLKNALQKINYQMNEEQQQELNKYTQGFAVVTPTAIKIDKHFLHSIEEAIASTTQISLQYQKKGSSLPEIRQVDPYSIIHWNKKWYLIAYCHLRKAKRTFRIDRIINIEKHNASFHRPHNFVATDFFLNWLSPDEEQGNFVPLVIQGSKESIQYLRHHWYLQHFFVHQTETEIQFLVEREMLTTKIPHFLLTYETSITVMEPTSLQNSLIKLVQKLAEHYQQ